MRKDIQEAYERVMTKHWQPARNQDMVFKALTQQTATRYCKVMSKKWRGNAFSASSYKFVKGFKEGRYAQRRTGNWTIALTNWEDLNHEFSHWWFYLYGGIRLNDRGREHHCDRHLEWEYTGADWICKHMLTNKTSKDV